MKERNPKDPRVTLSNHREHGPHRGTYTYEDIAAETGLTLGTVRAYGAGERRQFTLRDFHSVVAFILARRVRSS